MKKTLKILLGLVIVIIIAAAVYLTMGGSLGSSNGGFQTGNQPIGGAAQTPNYTNQTHHFSLSYPTDLNLKPAEFVADQGDVVTIEDSKTGIGMQVYITPFAEDLSVLTVARIKQDMPDLEIIDPQDVTIGQSGKGVAFFDGSDAKANRQIWFVVGKELYQITAQKSFDQTLKGIMNTWNFF